MIPAYPAAGDADPRREVELVGEGGGAMLFQPVHLSAAPDFVVQCVEKTEDSQFAVRNYHF